MNMKTILTNIVHIVPILKYPKPNTPESKKIATYFTNMELRRLGSKLNNRPLNKGYGDANG